MNPIENIKSELRDILIAALESCRAAGLIAYDRIGDFVIEKPREKEHGDYATNIAMVMAREAKMAPGKIAQLVVEHIPRRKEQHIERIEIAGAGFINFHLSPGWLDPILPLVAEMGDAYGNNAQQGVKIQIEFVSANPTGNLHMGNARGGAIGDTLAHIFNRAGYEVDREFYLNDAGNQIELFARSLEARYLELMGVEADFPEDGYAGRDVVETVETILQEHAGELEALEPEARREKLLQYALAQKTDAMRSTLAAFGVEYDVWFRESSLYREDKISEVVRLLQEKELLYEKEGALWFRATAFGDQKDEVLIRGNQAPTYFAGDIAYHLNKYQRGFDRVINIWGADHHGHIRRLKGALEALGIEPSRLDIVIIQLVRLFRGGEMVRMSKRTGTTVTLDELIEEVGRDAARFFFVMRSPDSHLDFDLELAQKESQENPVYYVQYAYARICSIFRQAEAAGITMNNPHLIEAGRLREAEEVALMKKLVEFPEEIAVSARTMAPQRIARYVLDLAALFHSFYNHHRVINDDEDLQQARLLLMAAAGITLKNALGVLGVSAPQQM